MKSYLPSQYSCLKGCVEELAEVWKDTFNTSLFQAVVLVCLKTFTIILVLKSAAMTSMNEWLSAGSTHSDSYEILWEDGHDQSKEQDQHQCGPRAEEPFFFWHSAISCPFCSLQLEFASGCSSWILALLLTPSFHRLWPTDYCCLDWRLHSATGCWTFWHIGLSVSRTIASHPPPSPLTLTLLRVVSSAPAVHIRLFS